MFARILVNARTSCARPLMIVPQTRSISLNHILRQEEGQEQPQRERRPFVPGSKVYIGNLNYATTWQALKSFIQESLKIFAHFFFEIVIHFFVQTFLM